MSASSSPRPAPLALAHQAVELASGLLRQALELQTPQERRQQAELDRMLNHAGDKATLVEMTDQAFRTRTPARVADQLTHLLDVQGIPRFFNPVEQAMLRGFQSFGEYLPGVAVPLVKEKMRRETANVILPADDELLREHLRNRQQHRVRMNLNLLGEAILGENEARRRIQQCIDALRLEEVRCLSVKISTLYSQVSPLARAHTISKASDRLETLYRTAEREIDPETGTGKFVYLDMEEYRDLYLTADILCETLQRPGLQQARAGIALQAYIPDSFLVMQRLVRWSTSRVAEGGTPLTIRLVKGANMEMERVEASIGGHPQAPYRSKLETDANFKAMLRGLIDAAAEGNVRIGLASHNLFDVALGLIWAKDHVPPHAMQIEMLEGMANHQRRAISEVYPDLLLYAPACHREGFLNAISYLVRRLDENTGPQNFLRHAYRLQPGSAEFDRLANDFRRSLEMMSSVSHQPRRQADRHRDPVQPPAADHWSSFVNEPDTDWSMPANAAWAESIVERWKVRCGDRAATRPLWIGNAQAEDDGSQWDHSDDPSRPGTTVCHYQSATLPQLEQIVDLARQDPSGWSQRSVEDRHQLLRAVAQNLRRRRGDLIGAMIAEGGKTIAEADPEVSEAIDFCEFYPLTVRHWHQQPELRLQPRGVIAVITPWNFPLAIPCGGVTASLMAGNRVILKPAPETPFIAALLCDAFWDAGVPREALQLAPCDDETAEAGLIRNEHIDGVILTGGTATARHMLEVRPNLHLIAETGGKNATIVTAMADRDQAIKHIVHSAFSHSGQKCSATSLLLLEREVFDDELFQRMLADAVESLAVGPAWDLPTRVGPLISPPRNALARGLKTLEDDEWWLVVPEHVVGNPNLYRPGVKWNIQPDGFMHCNELFGPVLGVMPFTHLEEAVELVRRTGFGLTSGLETLDDREIKTWKDSIPAGNLYINRSTTGAIVLRQPFGGMGLSAYGPGVKAGGPHYVLPLMHIEDAPDPSPNQPNLGPNQPNPGPNQPHRNHDRSESHRQQPHRILQLQRWIEQASSSGALDPELSSDLAATLESCVDAVEAEFACEHDHFRLVGQDNVRRYRPVKGITIRVAAHDQPRDGLRSIIAAVSADVPFVLSVDRNIDEADRRLLESTADAVPGLVHPVEESETELAARIRRHDVARLRRTGPMAVSSPIALACAEAFVPVIAAPVLKHGPIECLRYLQEQAVSHDYHRYGNLGRRADEPRREVL